MRALVVPALVIAGLVAACQPGTPSTAASPGDGGDAETAAAASAEATSPSSADVSARPTPIAQGNRLRGSVSRLGADVSGLRGLIDQLGGEVREDDILVQLPADTLFGFDEADILPAFEAPLATLAELIQKTDGPVQLIGHTDDRGEAGYNRTLSERRAEAVSDWLQAHGIPGNRLHTSGLGASAPVADNRRADGSDDPEGRARNRRVEAVIPTG